MGMWIGRNRKARVTYGFDEIALVPGRVTINPNEVDITFRLPRKNAEPLALKIPIFASAMDGVVDVKFAVAMSKRDSIWRSAVSQQGRRRMRTRWFGESRRLSGATMLPGRTQSLHQTRRDSSQSRCAGHDLSAAFPCHDFPSLDSR